MSESEKLLCLSVTVSLMELTSSEELHEDKVSEGYPPPNSDTCIPKRNESFTKDFINDLQEKYFRNLQTMNTLMKEKHDLNSELNVTKKYLKHERKCNHLHRILRLSRSGDEIDQDCGGDAKGEAECPPKYNENIDQSALRTKGSSTAPFPLPHPKKKQIRPQSAESGLRRAEKWDQSSPRLSSTVIASVISTERLQLEELEYQRDQADYEAKRITEQEDHEKLMRSLRRSYEKNPCLDWQTHRKLKEDRRRKSQQRQKDHYHKWKIMNQQFSELNQHQATPRPPPGNGNGDEATETPAHPSSSPAPAGKKSPGLINLKKKLKSINKKWQADQFKALQRKQLFDSTRHLRDSHRMTLQERQEEEQDRRYRLKQAEVMAMIMESRREYEKRRRRKLRVEEEKYEKVKREEEMSRRDQAMQREKREAEHLLEEKRRQEMELKEKKSQRMRERRELKYRDQKRKEELEKLFKTVPPEIKETKSSVDRVKAIKEAKKVQLEKEIERKEYFETMRSKYFDSKPAIPTDGGGGINLRAFLKTAKT